MTKDVSSITNSSMMDIEKAFRKNGIGGVTHKHYNSNRQLIEGMVAIMIAEAGEQNGTNIKSDS